MAVAKQSTGRKAAPKASRETKKTGHEDPKLRNDFTTDLMRLLVDERLSDALPLAIGGLQARQALNEEEIAAVLHLLQACSERINMESSFFGLEREEVSHSDQLVSIFDRMIGLLREQGEQIAVLNGIVAELT